MSGVKLAVKCNHDVGVFYTGNYALTLSVAVAMKPNLFMDGKGLHGHYVTSIVVKCSRDEVGGTKTFCLLVCNFHEINTFSQAWTFVEGANEVWQEAETLVVREKVVSMELIVPTCLDFGEKNLCRVQYRSPSAAKGGQCFCVGSDGTVR